jgi:hypothetical protein
MILWIMFQKKDFPQNRWEKCIYSCVVGVMYCFSFFNLLEGQSRRRAFAFYVIIIVENLACLVLFLSLDGIPKSGFAVVAVAVIVGGTVLGT